MLQPLHYLYILHDGCFSSLRARLLSYKSYSSKNLWPLKCGPSLKRCTKSVSRSVLNVLCIEGISGWNIWVRDSGTLEPIMVLRPVKEKSGACFGKAGVIQLFRNALRGNCHKQYAVQSCTLLQETLRRFFKLDVMLKNWVYRMKNLVQLYCIYSTRLFLPIYFHLVHTRWQINTTFVCTAAPELSIHLGSNVFNEKNIFTPVSTQQLFLWPDQ